MVAQGTEDCLMLSLSLAYREKDNYTPPPPPPQVSPLTLFGSFRPGKSTHREIDVNRSYTSTTTIMAEKAAEHEEEEEKDAANLVSSPNSTLSSISGKRIDRDRHYSERASSSDEEGGGGGGDTSASRKKLRLCKEQAMVLEEAFREHNTLNPKQKTALAKQLNLRPRQVEVWFQNRRARTKLKQNEVDCEYLRRYCENLIQENKRLEKELNELRALKLSSPSYYNNYMTMSPPTTLTMCPQCVRDNNNSTIIRRSLDLFVHE